MTRRRRPPVPPAYLEKLLAVLGDVERLPVGAFVITVRHDDWCDLLNGCGPCNCDPEVDKPERVQ